MLINNFALTLLYNFNPSCYRTFVTISQLCIYVLLLYILEVFHDRFTTDDEVSHIETCVTLKISFYL